MMQSQQVLERFLDTPQARKIASDIEREKETKREAIQKRMTELRREREKTVAEAEPAFRQAKQRHQDALDALPVVRKALFKADSEFKNARALHATELSRLEHELEALR